jgi:acetolactate synthase-1/2/3 large subunit
VTSTQGGIVAEDDPRSLAPSTRKPVENFYQSCDAMLGRLACAATRP